MLFRKVLVLCAVLLSASALFAQEPAQKTFATPPTFVPPRIPFGAPPQYIRPETPEQRQARLGTPDDPGPNPDPSKHYFRFGRSYHIEKFDRRWENWEECPDGLVRPFGYLNVQREVYQLDNQWIWVWMPDPIPQDEAAAAEPPSRYNDQQINYLQDLRPEFSPLEPNASNKVVRFEKSSEGLPTTGSWRNSLAVADMNGDGCPDIIAPAERKGNEQPAIFLGDCKGHWKLWTAVKWPRLLDYGSVVASDFNKDGVMDLAFASHLDSVYVLLGDGKGDFKQVSSGLPQRFGSRKLVVSDVDGDGNPDIIAISEGPSGLMASQTPEGRVRVYLNRNHGQQWQEVDVAAADKPTAGDWLSVGHLTASRVPDVVAATIYQNSNSIVYVSEGPKKWKPVSDPYLIPFLSYYTANATGRFTSKKFDDAIVSYTRTWPDDVPSNLVPNPVIKNVIGIDRISLYGKKATRTPIVRWEGTRGIYGVAAGDFDGDGNLDIIYTRYDPREAVVLLGDGKGGFTRATVEGLTLRPNSNYDVRVADVNGDGRPDVILMYESSGRFAFGEQNGAIDVFLNQGSASAPAQAKK
ncbi:MAG TPA: VCBS repeat-containing protein [Vicinamibacterales bacterium]|nr:VCBS repeat-containing protein [Thermoanaerobaculia bacterium]HUK34740.1 VCBS repeat-containing protein [Vicinamibacterales bacterium]